MAAVPSPRTRNREAAGHGREAGMGAGSGIPRSKYEEKDDCGRPALPHAQGPGSLRYLAGHWDTISQHMASSACLPSELLQLRQRAAGQHGTQASLDTAAALPLPEWPVAGGWSRGLCPVLSAVATLPAPKRFLWPVPRVGSFPQSSMGRDRNRHFPVAVPGDLRVSPHFSKT